MNLCITLQLINFPLIESSFYLQQLLNNSYSPNIQISIEIFKEYILHSEIKSLFYHLLLHAHVTEEQLEQFMLSICQLAFDTVSYLGFFKELFMNRILHGNGLSKNIFFTTPINPSIISNDDNIVHRRDSLVHQLPQVLESLKVSYEPLEQTSFRNLC
ncbi:unnamed protein product [Adineta steineri]|uniref:Uncharacterized protein n=1 Tax=Adineta steineri TaxID=433720 RepID=A0A814J3R4_9BILA|nr:unnamed protein product [Adineta steineri]CAF1031538.1 unnamed protein product [Adineta steineri]